MKREPKKRSRQAYGIFCSAAITACNVLLSALKFFAGYISGSLAITADAVNNLTDALSSVVSIIGFRIAGKKADADHPFGHGRVEYIAGLAVSFLILLAGAELLRASIEKALFPTHAKAGPLAIAIIALSIALKCILGLYTKSVGKIIASSALEAEAQDSFADALSSMVVLASLAFAHFFPNSAFPFDGATGILVACLILHGGASSLKKTVNPLIGSPANPELAKKIKAIVLAHKPISGIHDLVVHDYGPTRTMITLHAEVPGKSSIFEMHKVIDEAENDIMIQTGCQAVIHMDPVDLENPDFIRAKQAVSEILKEINPTFAFHDLQLVPEKHSISLAFDVVAPSMARQKDMDEAALRKAIDEKAKARLGKNFRCLVRIEESFG